MNRFASLLWAGRTLPVRLGVLIALLMTPFWLRIPNAPPPFSADYWLGYAAVIPILAAGVMWLLVGLPGITRLRGARVVWALALVGLVLWSALSTEWAFVRADYAGVAINSASQLGLAVLFALAVTCAGPQRRHLILVLAMGVLVFGVWALLQVARQHDLGWQALGEIRLDPARRGVSVIQAGDWRFLRAYGPSAHPNIFAGAMVIGTLAAAALLFDADRRVAMLGLGLVLLGGVVLLFTFSRGAWLGLAIGAGVALVLLRKPLLTQPVMRRRLLLAALLSLLVGALFVVRFRPLLLARVGVAAEETERVSVDERALFYDIALTALQRYPVQGIGAGNFPWFSSIYLYEETPIRRAGDNAHSVALTVLSELGSVGGVLLLVVVGSWLVTAVRLEGADQALLVGAVIALIVIGLFDHYPWTLPQNQALWLALMGVTMRPQLVSAAAATAQSTSAPAG